MKRTIKIRQSEFLPSSVPEDVRDAESYLLEKAVKFERLLGKDTYKDMLLSFSKQRLGDGTLDKLAEMTEVLDPRDDKAHEKWSEQVRIATEKMADKTKDVYYELEVPEHALTNEFADQFIEIFGTRRYAEAKQFADYPDATVNSLFRVNPDAQSYSEKIQSRAIQEAEKIKAKELAHKKAVAELESMSNE